MIQQITPTSKKNISGRFFVAYIVLTLVIYLLPSLKLVVPYILAAVFMLLFFPASLLKMHRELNYHVLILFAAFLSGFLYFANDIYGLTDMINEMVRWVRFFLPIIWTVYALRFCSSRQRRNLLIVFGLVVAFMLFKTLQALETNGWITRILAQDKAKDSAVMRAYRMANIGGFEFSYLMGIVVLCLVWGAFKCQKKIHKILCIVGAVVGFYYIIQTMYMTLLILTLLGILLLLFFNVKKLFPKIFLICGSIVLAFSIVPLCKYLSQVFVGSLLSDKFLQLYTMLTGGGADSMGSRPGLIADAFERWAHSPIWGGYGFSDATHSLVFSTLESTGLIGLISFGGCLWCGYKRLSSELNRMAVPTGLLSIVFSYIAGLAVLNPIGFVFEVTIAAFFITPLWSTLLCAGDSAGK